MAQEPNDIGLDLLRRLDLNFDAVAQDMRSVSVRMVAMESHMAGLLASLPASAGNESTCNESTGNDSREIERLKRRVDRIERQLGLAGQSQ